MKGPYIVLKTVNGKHRALLTTEIVKYAETKFDLEATKLNKGSIQLIKIKKVEVLKSSKAQR